MLKLFGHASRTSPNSLKLRAALAEVGAEYQYVPVDLATGGQKTPEFLDMNAHGKIPVLLDDGFALPESDAILWYIAEKFPAGGLLPAASANGGLATLQSRARVLQWCDFTSTGLYPAYLDSYVHTVFAAPEKRVASIAESAAKKLTRAATVMEQTLVNRRFLAGDQLSIADFAAAATVQIMKARLPEDPTGKFPHLTEWYQRITARPAWQVALSES
jgi:glutathione S-transferase